MYGVVKIGDKDIEMVANAATPFRFKAVFHKDLIVIMTGGDTAEISEVIPEIAFIMAKQAEKADMNKLNIDTFLDWLEQFAPLDVYTASDGIWSVFNGTGETNTDPK